MAWKKGQSGNPKGKPPGARARLNSSFIHKMAKDWGKHGDVVLETVRTQDPSTYLRVVASLLPKENNHIHDVGSNFTAMLESVNKRAISDQSNVIDVTPAPTTSCVEADDKDE